jgi:hypothetical protein
MGVEQWGGMSGKLYSKDPYLSAFGNDSLLFSTAPKAKPHANGKLDPLAFSDPLAFGDPLAFRPRDGEEEKKAATEEDTEDTESEVEEWPSAPPVDYLDKVQVGSDNKRKSTYTY